MLPASYSKMSVSSTSRSIPSRKPWFLSFDPETKLMFIWKEGMRLKLKGGVSFGNVESINLQSEKDGTVQVMFKSINADTSQYACTAQRNIPTR